MSVRITIDIFSGRPNPFVELEGKKAAEVFERFRPARALTAAEVEPVPPIPTLGYRGVVLEQIGRPRKSFPKLARLIEGQVILPEGVAVTEDERVEDFLFGAKGILTKAKLEKGLMPFIQRQRVRFREVRRTLAAPAKSKAAKKLTKVAKAAAPGCNLRSYL